MTCQNSFKQLGIALHNYHGAYGAFPAGWLGENGAGVHFVDGTSGLGWAAALLPYLEQAPLYDSLDMQRSILSDSNAAARVQPIPVLRCASDSGAAVWEIVDRDSGEPLARLATANYVGCFGTEEIDECEETPLGKRCESNGMFFHNSKLQFRDILDGTSMTIMVGERTARLNHSTWIGNVPGGDDSYARILGVADHPPNYPGAHAEDFSSLHPGGTQFLYADGRVQFVSENIDERLYRAQCTRAGGEVVSGND